MDKPDEEVIHLANLEAENKALKERLEKLEKAALRAEQFICDVEDLLNDLDKKDEDHPTLISFIEAAFDDGETFEDIHDALKHALPDHFDMD